MRRPTSEVPQEVILQERAVMQAVAEMEDRPETYYIVTYGCQMNVHDSEKIEGMLVEMGLTRAEDRESADFVIFNTCCVRDNAERRALGNVTWLKEIKKKHKLYVAVCGCMIQEPGMADHILRQYPFVDLAFGTHNLYHFPTLFQAMINQKRRVIEVSNDEWGYIPEDLPIIRNNPYEAFITIMYGCNNFCSYCIVPAVRGRERSRSSVNIIEEAKMLASQGVREIMLLGQNVNSYGKDRPGEMTFPQLLAELDKVGIDRIRFMTSHPKDASIELMDVMARSRHICPAFHLPVQHGNDRILASMNRHYDRATYLEKVKNLRERIPDISLTTDLIVAYPGETEQEFEDTLSLVEEVRYDSAFTFIYSPRVGTPAAKMTDVIDPQVASDRIQRLIAVQKQITSENLSNYIGRICKVLVNSTSKRDSAQMTGKNEYNIAVNFTGNSSMIGKILPVLITGTKETTLQGEIAGEEIRNGQESGRTLPN